MKENKNNLSLNIFKIAKLTTPLSYIRGGNVNNGNENHNYETHDCNNTNDSENTHGPTNPSSLPCIEANRNQER